MSKHRTQLLLEPKQHEQLYEIAQHEQKSLSEVVREAVEMYLTHRSTDSRRQRAIKALEQAQAVRDRIMENHGGWLEVDPVAALNEIRKERDTRTLGTAKDVPDEKDRD